MCCTNDDDLAFRLKAIRNHGENICDPAASKDSVTNLIGFNFRMTEMLPSDRFRTNLKK